MASGASKPTAFMLLILNMGLYFFMIIISSWIINHGIVRSRESGESDSLQAYICSLKDWFFQAITDLCMHALPCVNVYAAAILTIPARIFPIYFPMGNLATGFFIILSLLAGVVGFTSSITGLYNLFLWNAPSIHATYASSLASLSLTLLAMGLMLTLSLSFSVLRIFLLFFFFYFQTHIQFQLFQVGVCKLTKPFLNVHCRFACKEINIGWTDSVLVCSLFFFLVMCKCVLQAMGYLSIP